MSTREIVSLVLVIAVITLVFVVVGTWVADAFDDWKRER
jgi:hypothetical protein